MLASLTTAALLGLAGCSGTACDPGKSGCACLPGGSCSGAMLFCDSDLTCKALSCDQGAEGCGCLDSGACQSEAGVTLLCLDRLCVRSNCSAGTEGCLCRTDGSCLAGSQCMTGICRSLDTLNPPPAPVCYTPCKSSLALSDGTYVPCGADGLMA